MKKRRETHQPFRIPSYRQILAVKSSLGPFHSVALTLRVAQQLLKFILKTKNGICSSLRMGLELQIEVELWKAGIFLLSQRGLV